MQAISLFSPLNLNGAPKHASSSAVRCFVIGLALLLGPLSCAPPQVVPYQARAGVTVNDHVETYAIRGKTLQELRSEIDMHGPVSLDTVRTAITRAEIHWAFQYARQGTICRLADVAATVDATIIVPRWADSSEVDPAAVYWWRNKVEELRVHEGAHLQIAVDAASEIRNRLLRITGSDCSDLGREANRTAAAIVRESYDKQRALDSRTMNGAFRASP